MSAHHWAEPGVRCVCVDDDWDIPHDPYYAGIHRVPMLNEVLTVRSVRMGDPSGPYHDLVFLTFDEIPADDVCRWDVDAFRPLITKSQDDDIALFAPLLDTSRVTEPA